MEENKLREEAHQVTGDNSILKRIFQDRKRTNILSGVEQSTISWLVKRIPSFISSDMLTFIGTAGCVIYTLLEYAAKIWN